MKEIIYTNRRPVVWTFQVSLFSVPLRCYPAVLSGTDIPEWILILMLPMRKADCDEITSFWIETAQYNACDFCSVKSERKYFPVSGAETGTLFYANDSMLITANCCSPCCKRSWVVLVRLMVWVR